MYLAPLLTSGPPVYSGKYRSRGTLGSFALKRSILLRKRMIEVRCDGLPDSVSAVSSH